MFIFQAKIALVFLGPEESIIELFVEYFVIKPLFPSLLILLYTF